MLWRTAEYSRSPAGVNSSARVRRTNSGLPTCRSSEAIWRLIDDCVRFNSAAASVNDRWRAALSKPRSVASAIGRAGRRAAAGLADIVRRSAPVRLGTIGRPYMHVLHPSTAIFSFVQQTP